MNQRNYCCTFHKSIFAARRDLLQQEKDHFKVKPLPAGFLILYTSSFRLTFNFTQNSKCIILEFLEITKKCTQISHQTNLGLVLSDCQNQLNKTFISQQISVSRNICPYIVKAGVAGQFGIFRRKIV